jgi:plastocyanin
MITTKRATIASLGIAAGLVLGACGGGGGGDSADAKPGHVADPAAAAAPTLAIEAHEFGLAPADPHAAPGDVAIRYKNTGAIEHTLLIDGVAGFKLDVVHGGDVDSATVKLAPGTYTLYCDIPGHRAAGMEAHLTVG